MHNYFHLGFPGKQNTKPSDAPETATPPTPGVKKTINKPKHDTEKGTSMSKTHWRKTTRQHLADQLSKHGWKWPKTPAGNMQLKRPELQQIMYNLLGI